MKKIIDLSIITLLLTLLFLNIDIDIYAAIYRVINPEGNTVRVSVEPVLKEQEIKDGCKIYLLELGTRIDVLDRDNKVRGEVFLDINDNGKRENGEQGISNIQVSNGKDIALTDSEGNFELDREDTFIFLTLPRDYSMTTSWYRINTDKNTSFGLKKDKKEEDQNFSFIHLTDPHVTLDEEYNDIIKTAVSEINSFKPDFTVVTGDMVFEGDKTDIEQTRKWFDRYISLVDRWDMPVYHTIGNHDVAGVHYKKDVSEEPGYDKWLYYSYFGPSYYSFNQGNYHCIVLDPIQFENDKQYFEIPQEQVLWLKHDLSFYSEDMPLLIFSHIPLNSWTNKEEILSLFENRKVIFFSGHWHFDVLLTHHGENTLEQVTNSLCAGWWKRSSADGRSEGYRVVQLSEDKIESFYREIGQERQIKVINPKPFVSQLEEIKVQIYTEKPPLISVKYQINEEEWFPMVIEEQGVWFVASSSNSANHLSDSDYHQLKIKVNDMAGYFTETVNFKVSSEEKLSFRELYDNFSVFQGHPVTVEGKIQASFLQAQHKTDNREIINGIIFLKDQSDKGIILIGEYGIKKNEELKRGQFISADVVPLRFDWNLISRKQKLMLLLILYRLPDGFLEINGLYGPEAVQMLWLTNHQVQVIDEGKYFSSWRKYEK